MNNKDNVYAGGGNLASTDVNQENRLLTKQDYKTLSLAALGGALEFYDFIIFVFFATVIGKLFFPPSVPEWLRQLQTFGIFAAGYLARPLGGIIMAHFGDLLGRKRMFTLSILLMSVPTLMMGLLPTYQTIGIFAPIALLILRILQGAAVGGEVPGAWVFVSEHVPAKNVGYACGTLTAGLTSGILLGSLVATAMNTIFTPVELTDWAWRLPFLLGGIFGIAAMYLRRWLHETPVFAELQKRKALAAEMPLKTVLRDHRGAVAVSMLLTWMLSAAIVVVILMTPTFLQKIYGFDGRTALMANSVATLCLTAGCVVAGLLSDKFGAKRILFLGDLFLLICTYFLFTTIKTNPEMLLPLYALTGFAVGVVGAVPFVLVNAFPAQVRFSGLSFSYNVAYAIFGGLTPIVVTLLLKDNPLAPAYYVMGVCVIGMLTAMFVRDRSAIK
ncbi:MFS transporter [Undibacterium sp. RTI2.1]|uniref:MFS transporter n=1 Tax=unclassified Undibacterium TaxID=2630295 RepID=UPI002AB38F7D|nr:MULTISPECIES: MFS transporter [unclassified Undibacterium]MDY7537203.1 MFS transporter [Undibacterium sp. 5I1]MEB0031328.1 MFS transporter [Undibacterium sp. RTI2.1]MEB0117697.1 MFS transporter [Undibacterium sp. RTI2.2]MEB0231492.1 MFS transporter [Undibacterium sp. 10I3]MEB0258999.1 MFS transporter [Undibacterium sp. 5I1]